MGLVIGVIMSVLGLGMLVIPFVIDLYISRRQTDKTKATEYKRALEASAGLIIIASLFLIGGIVLVGFASTWDVAKAGFGGAEGGWAGESGETKGGSEGNNNALLTYMLLKQKGAEGSERAGAEEEGGLAAEAEELGEVA